jgi:hypothetical protein
MTRHTLVILIIFLLVAVSCSGKKGKTERIKIIPEKDLVPILIDLNMANGLLLLADVRSRYADFDSTSTYVAVIEKYGYTKKDMDKTMEYYFFKKPQKLIAIYDQVLGVLSQQETLIEKEFQAQLTHSANLWTGKESYFFPGITGADSGQINLVLNKPGTYTLSYTSTFFPDDQSINPQFTGYTCSPDSLETGKKNYIKTLYYLKDNRPHTNTITIKITGNRVLQLNGFLYDFNSNPENCERHAIFENISFTFAELTL